MPGQRMPQRPAGRVPMRRFKKGGKVKETGPAVVSLRARFVIPAKQAKKPL